MSENTYPGYPIKLIKKYRKTLLSLLKKDIEYERTLVYASDVAIQDSESFLSDIANSFLLEKEQVDLLLHNQHRMSTVCLNLLVQLVIGNVIDDESLKELNELKKYPDTFRDLPTEFGSLSLKEIKRENYAALINCENKAIIKNILEFYELDDDLVASLILKARIFDNDALLEMLYHLDVEKERIVSLEMSSNLILGKAWSNIALKNHNSIVKSKEIFNLDKYQHLLLNYVFFNDYNAYFMFKDLNVGDDYLNNLESSPNKGMLLLQSIGSLIDSMSKYKGNKDGPLYKFIEGSLLANIYKFQSLNKEVKVYDFNSFNEIAVAASLLREIYSAKICMFNSLSKKRIELNNLSVKTVIKEFFSEWAIFLKKDDTMHIVTLTSKMLEKQVCNIQEKYGSSPLFELLKDSDLQFSPKLNTLRFEYSLLQEAPCNDTSLEQKNNQRVKF